MSNVFLDFPFVTKITFMMDKSFTNYVCVHNVTFPVYFITYLLI